MPALRLEVFDTETTAAGETYPLVQMSALEEAKIAAFEKGYTAGWDDAVAATETDQSLIRADLARNLQSLAFSFQEARSHVLGAVRPLILEMVNRLLPELAREALAPMVLEGLMPIAESLADTPLTLVMNHAVRTRIEAVLTQATGLPLIIEDEPSLDEGQVYIRFGAAETKVDLTQATATIANAVNAFFALTKEETSHG
ncbi:MAG: flagellar biosynthesis protein [Tabrizicola sp.]|nr:flagellar biosynthesis protein [Tabrizicola sp.]